jgi:hypothetical protein
MSTSNYPDRYHENTPGPVLAWRVFRYLTIRLVLGTLRLSWWLVTRAILFCVGVLRIMASPASSGRSQDEFKDLVQPPQTPEGEAPRYEGADGFWRMYLQAYSPRLWRMRRLLPMSAGKVPPKEARQDDK